MNHSEKNAPRLLALEGSGPAASVALFEGDDLVFFRFRSDGLTHSETLLPSIEGILQDSGWTYEDLDALAVTDGPGSFTGLRIALATIKTLGYILQIPIYPVHSTEVLAAPWKMAYDWVLPLIDARSGRAFSSLYHRGEPVLPIQNRNLKVDLPPELDRLSHSFQKGERFFAVGSAQALAGPLLAPYSDCLRMETAAPLFQEPRADWLGRIALERRAAGDPGLSPMAVQAYYAALSQPERLRLEAEAKVLGEENLSRAGENQQHAERV